jgi:protein-L-isoaspartate(D-aspartate) O-methyltransferase
MTQAAAPEAIHKCLEIGTGSGYQAAVLAELCKKVYSIEYLEDVAKFGRDNLRAAGYPEARVALRVGDGYRGWPEAAPFDVILVTAAPDHVPKPLLEQLAMNGKLVIPVGGESAVQELERWTRIAPGMGTTAFRREQLMGVRFVPFLGDDAKRAH